MLLATFVSVIAIFACYKIMRSLRIKKLHEKHVFITGCDSGFGKSLAIKLDKQGLYVFAACLLDKSVGELKSKCSERLLALKVDVTKSSDLKQAVEIVKQRLGGNSLWCLVNNAGISIPTCTFEWLTKEDYQAMLDVNLLGTIDTTLHFYPLIRKGNQGRIVNVASQYGRFAPSAAPYMVSKFGVEGFSDGLSKESRYFNVSVHTIEPGFFKTNILAKQEESFNNKWQSLDKSCQKVYGDDFRKQYLELLQGFYKNSSENVHWVVDAMSHAVTARYPKERYVVGYDAMLFYIPCSYLPCFIQGWLMDIFGKITGLTAPVPAKH